MPRPIRKAAETEVPMMLPTVPRCPNLELMAEAVAAITMEVMMTILYSSTAFSLSVDQKSESASKAQKLLTRLQSTYVE